MNTNLLLVNGQSSFAAGADIAAPSREWNENLSLSFSTSIIDQRVKSIMQIQSSVTIRQYG